MRQIFKESRIKFSELLSDARTYLTEVHNQNNKTYTPASPFGQILTAVVGLTEKVFYYIEDAISENNINSASRSSSKRGLIALTGYQPKNATSASGLATIRYNGKQPLDSQVNQIILPNYTRVFCPANNLYYLTQSNSEIRFYSNDKEKTISVKLIQGEIFEQTFTGTGLSLQSFRINERFSDFVDLDSLVVKVNGLVSKRYYGLNDIPLGELGYQVRTSVGGGIDIFFGTLYNGTPPPPGATISVSYIKNSGSAGNIIDARDLRFEFVDEGFDNQGNSIDLNEYLSVEAQEGLVLGSNPEPIDVTVISGPKHSRSFVLSNTDAYESYLNRMNYFSTVDVFNTFEDDNLDDDNVVYMFLIPNLSLRISPKYNYFTAPLSSFLMTGQETTQLLETIEGSGQVMIGTEFEIIQPTIKKFTLHVIINYFKGHSKELIRTNIIDQLSDYFINYTRRDTIPKSDIIAMIEYVDGVDSVNVYFKEDPANYSVNDDTYITEMGDIQIGKKDYPIIRGGWTDDTGVTYLEDLSENLPSSLNITFNKEVEKNSNRIKNKSLVTQIRNRR